MKNKNIKIFTLIILLLTTLILVACDNSSVMNLNKVVIKSSSGESQEKKLIYSNNLSTSTRVPGAILPMEYIKNRELYYDILNSNKTNMNLNDEDVERYSENNDKLMLVGNTIHVVMYFDEIISIPIDEQLDDSEEDPNILPELLRGIKSVKVDITFDYYDIESETVEWIAEPNSSYFPIVFDDENNSISFSKETAHNYRSITLRVKSITHDKGKINVPSELKVIKTEFISNVEGVFVNKTNRTEFIIYERRPMFNSHPHGIPFDTTGFFVGIYIYNDNEDITITKNEPTKIEVGLEDGLDTIHPPGSEFDKYTIEYTGEKFRTVFYINIIIFYRSPNTGEETVIIYRAPLIFDWDLN